MYNFKKYNYGKNVRYLYVHDAGTSRSVDYETHGIGRGKYVLGIISILTLWVSMAGRGRFVVVRQDR